MNTNSSNSDFEKFSKKKRPGLIAEFWFFLKYNKKWWLIPILVILFLLGLLVILSGSAAAPFIYSLF